MADDVASLVRRDHDELDRILARMVDPAILTPECAGLVENLQLGFTAHAAAQGMVLRRLLGNLAPPPALLRATVSHMFSEHRDQARAIAALARVRPGSRAWVTGALELRVQMLDHAAREELLRASLGDALPREARRALAPGYATERLRRLGLLGPRDRHGARERWVFN